MKHIPAKHPSPGVSGPMPDSYLLSNLRSSFECVFAIFTILLLYFVCGTENAIGYAAASLHAAWGLAGTWITEFRASRESVAWTRAQHVMHACVLPLSDLASIAVGAVHACECVLGWDAYSDHAFGRPSRPCTLAEKSGLSTATEILCGIVFLILSRDVTRMGTSVRSRRVLFVALFLLLKALAIGETYTRSVSAHAVIVYAADALAVTLAASAVLTRLPVIFAAYYGAEIARAAWTPIDFDASLGLTLRGRALGFGAALGCAYAVRGYQNLILGRGAGHGERGTRERAQVGRQTKRDGFDARDSSNGSFLGDLRRRKRDFDPHQV